MGLHVRRSRRRFGWLTLPIALALLVPFAVLPSSAAWTDVEHVTGALRSANCTTGQVSAASGRLVNGTVLSTALSSIASVAGASASSPGTGSTVTSANPLSVSALGTINTQLGGVFQFDAGAQAGALQQYAEARPTGWSGGSAGAVANSGALALTPPAPGGPVPRFATLQLGSVLSQLLGSGTGGGITGLTDVSLAIGAVASYATLDGCAADWSNAVYTALDRQYALAGLSATMSSPTVGAITTTTNTGATNIRSLVAAVGGQSGLLNSIATGALQSISSLLTGVTAGTPTATLALDINLTGLATNLATPITDAAGIATINLGAGTVTVDLARLLGPAYQSSAGINGLAPNSQLLLNSAATSALLTAVSTALTSWIADVGATVNSAAAVVDVDLRVNIPVTLLGAPIAQITLTAAHVGLDKLIAGTAPVTATVVAQGICPAAGALVCGTINGLVAALTTTLTTTVLNGIVGPVVGPLIRTALTPVPGLATLTTNLTANANSLVSFLSTALSGLFGPAAVLSLIANAQNAPDPTQASSPPGALPGWTGLAAPTTTPYRTGQFSVAALRLVTLGFLSTGVSLDLARSTVGSNGPVP